MSKTQQRVSVSLSFYTTLLFITAFFASLWSDAVLAEDKAQAKTPLIMQLNENKANAIAAYNKRPIAEHGYFAKSLQIVQVDAEALLLDGLVSIPLGNNEELVLQRTDLSRTDAVSSYVWQGQLISPRPANTKSEIANAAKTLNVPEEQLLSEFFSVSLVISEWDLDRRTGLAQPGWQSKHIVIGGSEVDREKLPIKEAAFHSVDGQISVRAEGKTYRLTPLEYSPKYHLFYEIDPEKYFTLPEHHDRSVRAEEAREKAGELERHLERYPIQLDKQVVGEIN